MSELRDSFPVCPRCTTALDLTPDGSRLGCSTCEGLLVGEPALLEIITELAGEPQKKLPLEPSEIENPDALCPRCMTQMTKHWLYTIQVDRCPAHGIWFDGSELASVLERVKRIERPGSISENVKLTAFSILWFGALLAGVLLR